MKSLKTAIFGVVCYLYASILLWLPDALWHFWRGFSFAGIDMFVLTILLPGILAAGVLALLRLTCGRVCPMLTSIAMILGLLTTGPVWMMFNTSFSGGAGFAKAVPWRTLGILILLFPLSNLDLSTYDGTLFALALSILVLIFLPLCYKSMTRNSPGTLFGALRTDQ